MTDLRKAAEMALEALKDTHYRIIDAGLLDQDLLDRNFTVATALRQALAESANSTTDFVEPKASSQPEQEPVAWLIQYKDRHEFVWCNKTVSFKEQVLGIEPLYTAPPHHASDVKKREWDSEFLAGVEWAAKAIQAKLKEKNT